MAQDINNLGQVAGTCTTPTAMGGNLSHGFIRNPDGSITTVDVIALAGTTITGINNKGQVCGYSGNEGFIRDPNGTVTPITDELGMGVVLNGINDLGQVVGVGRIVFVRNPDGSFVKLTENFQPYGVNSSGQIVGSGVDQSTGAVAGFLLNSDGSSVTFEVPGSLSTVATESTT